MKQLITKCALGVSLIIAIPGLAVANGPKGCKHDMLRGQYVFTATGFSRAADGLLFPPPVPI